MPYVSPICFPPFRLDPGDARLWHEARPLPLRPKAFAVLHYLLQHPGQLVTVPLADVRAAPDLKSDLVFEAYKHVILEVAAPPAGDWVKVRHRDGQEGFIRVAHVWGV